MSNESTFRLEFHETRRNWIEARYIWTLPEGTTLWDLVVELEEREGRPTLSDKRMWDFDMTRRSRKKRRSLGVYINGQKVEVFPDENVFVVACGTSLHHICQHFADYLPSGVQRKLRYWLLPGDEPQRVGVLYTKQFVDHPAESLDVYAHDLEMGFMMDLNSTKKFGESFIKWIQYCNKSREEVS